MRWHWVFVIRTAQSDDACRSKFERVLELLRARQLVAVPFGFLPKLGILARVRVRNVALARCEPRGRDANVFLTVDEYREVTRPFIVSERLVSPVKSKEVCVARRLGDAPVIGEGCVSTECSALVSTVSSFRAPPKDAFCDIPKSRS